MSRGHFSLIDFGTLELGWDGVENREHRLRWNNGGFPELVGVSKSVHRLIQPQRAFISALHRSIPSTTANSHSITLRRSSRFASQIKPSANGVSNVPAARVENSWYLYSESAGMSRSIVVNCVDTLKALEAQTGLTKHPKSLISHLSSNPKLRVSTCVRGSSFTGQLGCIWARL